MINLIFDSGPVLMQSYPQVSIKYVQPEELAPFDREGAASANVNTPGDFQKITSALG